MVQACSTLRNSATNIIWFHQFIIKLEIFRKMKRDPLLLSLKIKLDSASEAASKVEWEKKFEIFVMNKSVLCLELVIWNFRRISLLFIYFELTAANNWFVEDAREEAFTLHVNNAERDENTLKYLVGVPWKFENHATLKNLSRKSFSNSAKSDHNFLSVKALLSLCSAFHVPATSRLWFEKKKHHLRVQR